jgi:hypothetical protein
MYSQKQKLYKKWRNHKTDDNFKKYNDLKNKVTSMCRKAQKQFNDNLFKNDNNNKKMWQEIGNMTQKNLITMKYVS